MNTLHNEVLSEFRGRLSKTGEHRIDHRRNRLLYRPADLHWRQNDGLRQPAHHFATAHLRVDFVFGWSSRTQDNLDVFRGSLSDRNSILAADICLHRAVDVERANPHRFKRNYSAKRQQGSFCGSTTDVNDHVANRFIDRKVSTNCSRDRLFNELRISGSGSSGSIGYGPSFDRGDRRRHANHHAGAIEAAYPHALQEKTDHPLRNIEIGDRALTKRAYRHDMARCPPDHLPRFAASSEHLLGATIHRDHGRLVQDDALPSGVHQRVRGAQVDR